MNKSILILACLISTASIGWSYRQAETHRQQGFQAAESMYDACADEADETKNEAEREFSADYIKSCVADINATDDAGYTLSK